MKKRIISVAVAFLLIISMVPSAFAEEGTGPSTIDTPQATETPQPTDIPQPTDTPQQTPEPAETSEPPQPTPEPSETSELTEMGQAMDAMQITDVTSEDYTYKVNSGGTTCTITGYNGSNPDIEIPASLNGMEVTTISGFQFNNVIESVVIQEGISKIDYATFISCNNLTSISIPKSIRIIEMAPFSYNGKLLSITVDSGNQYYTSDNGVLFNKAKTVLLKYPPALPGNYTIPSSVSEIQPYAFEGSINFSNMNIPGNVNIIGNDAFEDCINIIGFDVDSSNQSYSSQEGVLFNKNKTLLIKCPATKTGSYTIPNSVREIYSSAFERCSTLTQLVIPNSVTKLGFCAFRGCSGITSIDLPDGISEIPMWGFTGCISLQTVHLPNQLKIINDNAFGGCSGLMTIIIPDTVTDIGSSAFQYCSALSEVSFPDGITRIESGVLRNSGISEFDIPAGVSEIELSAFQDCKALSSITIPDSVSAIEIFAFAGCTSLENINLPDNISQIDGCAFEGCTSLSSVVLPAKVTCIEDRTFSGCTSLSSVTIPDGVTKIGYDVFSGCKSLSEIVIPQNVTEIGSGAFSSCTDLSNVTLPDGLMTIERYLFYNCTSLDTINIPSGVASIGESAFRECSVLKNISIPGNVTTIGESAFRDCTVLKNISIPESVTTIGPYAFWNCKSLPNISLSDETVSIGEGAFGNCSSLKDISIPDSVTDIGDSAFSGCVNLESVQLPDGITSIGDGMFYNCEKLKSIVLPGSVTKIGDRAFEYCDQLNTCYFYGNAPQMGDMVFNGCSYQLKICYKYDRSGYTNPWNGRPTMPFNPDVTCKVSFNLNGASGDTPPDQTLYQYMTLDEPKNTIFRSGYSFDGWYTTLAGNTDPVVFPYTVTENVTLYARWTNNCVVTFDTQGGSAISPLTVEYNSLINPPANPIKAYHTFCGWYLDISCVAGWSFAYDRVHGPVTLYAKWAAQAPSAYLSGASLSAGTLSRAFSKTCYSYKVNLGENEGSVTITPVKEFEGATMTIAGKAVSSYTVPVANGKSVTVKVKVAYGKTSHTYTYTVTRAKSTNNNLASLSATAGSFDKAFDAGVTNYTLTLDENTKSTKIMDTVAAPGLAKASPSSTKVTLSNGQTKVVKITVKAQSGAKKTYVITVTRAAATNAALKSLKTNSGKYPLSPAFSAGVTNYTVALPAATGSVTISAAAAGYKAVVYIDGKKKTSQKVSVSSGGSVTVHIVVTAQAGNTMDYYVTVTRP